MKVAIRTDASLHIGTGHVMRCLTLAERLRAAGAEVLFVCREHEGHLCQLVAARGYQVARLAPPAPGWQAPPCARPCGLAGRTLAAGCRRYRSGPALAAGLVAGRPLWHRAPMAAGAAPCRGAHHGTG
ncbi:hypothetical protein ACHMW6_35790 [Pseudoduganella sp. UC29_106]|uniref:hypothetical protein n=1 Tax=Pseudoduganella sp. UC29_106 TaxID=3374553 RepID=UPI0037574D35